MNQEVFSETNRKRPAPVEPTDGLDPAKRQRLAAQPPSVTPSSTPPTVVAGPPPVDPLPPGPVSYRQLYTLNEGNAAAFDVQMFQDPEQLLRILVPVLQSVDEAKLGHAINVRDGSLHPPMPRRCGLARSIGRARDTLSRDVRIRRPASRS